MDTIRATSSPVDSRSSPAICKLPTAMVEKAVERRCRISVLDFCALDRRDGSFIGNARVAAMGVRAIVSVDVDPVDNGRGVWVVAGLLCVPTIWLSAQRDASGFGDRIRGEPRVCDFDV